jgi:cobalt/nickel transport system permease protein
LSESFDPRIKILAALALVAIIVSGSGTGLRPFLFDFPLMTAAAAACRVSARALFRRAVRATPFILAAAALLPLSQPDAGPIAAGLWRRALVFALKAYASVFALSLLVMTDRLERLLGAMPSLGMPEALGSIMSLAGRFLFLLGEEAARMNRARESRTPGRLRVSRILLLGRAAGALFIRGWKRSRSVQAAMETRGFQGSFPVLNPPPRVRMGDALAAAVFLAPFAAVRIIWP